MKKEKKNIKKRTDSQQAMFLQPYLKKKYASYTKRGNASIKLALEAAKALGYSLLYIPDQGGWMTYEPLGEKLGFQVKKIPTSYGLINDISSLKKHSVVLLNAMPAYVMHLPMESLYQQTKAKDCLLITDLAGGIAYPSLYYGDILIGSFGRWKPLNVLEGGFIATDNEKVQEIIRTKNNYHFPYEEALQEKWNSLPERLKKIKAIKQSILDAFAEYKEKIITHEDAFNVIIRYETEEEKNRLLAYAKKAKIPTVLCPQYIKILEPAVSFEIKRFF